ncbi:LOW QUALITY PROTEIN: FACT complex subunit Ssrp1-like [Ctenocephalides felis]|uniref:LOW QUALITY PROTEIN: FACT complex subunit Ssrp1-like n=1 Tax=Ctenocephalides felis TaxID=7515 RepID=UPI000E6E56E4|nr:LOW QUALITY PROTEIN: FACT complex subunit Ssrp1-like [Ctenocephalides felis]
MDFLEYSDISSEVKGCMVPGKLKMTDQAIIFKNSKTGKVEQINSSDLEVVNFQKFVGNWGLRIFLKNGILRRFGGFKEGDTEKVAKFFKTNYKLDMLEKELSLKGWNWGTAKFQGSVLSFNVGHNTAFEIPLNHVSQCNTGKNEITIEFHQNDEAPVSLMEMRFHIPSSENVDVDPVDAFHGNVMKNASVISVTGDAIAIFREIQCLTPRGRYDIKLFQSFFQLHGKTFDYKIPMSTVLRLFLLPHRDQRQMFFVVSLDPPIKQGQTRYHYLVSLFGTEEETSIELPFTDEELQEKYNGKLSKELSGPTYDIIAKVMKNLINRKVTIPADGFKGASETPAVNCSFKAAAGYLYPLEKGFIYVHKPPLHIRFEEIQAVNFARGGGSTRSFDFEIELKSGTVHTFSSIEKEEYSKLFDFITSKKLHIKNTGKNDKALYKDDFGDSDNENEPDAYLARVKAEAEERDDDDQGSEEESTDEDFNPGEENSDVAEEYDSNHTDSESDEGSGEEKGDKDKSSKSESPEKKKHKHKSSSSSKSSKTVSEKPRKSKKNKKERDENKPKRPMTAFMLWMNENRDTIREKNPGLKITEIAKKGGEMWRELKDKSVWEDKAAKMKTDYNKAMSDYKASGGGSGDKKSPKKKSSSSSSSKKTSSPTKSSGDYKSKEYISDDSSSSEDDAKDKDKIKKEEKSSKDDTKSKDDKKPKSEEKPKSKAESDGDEDEEMEEEEEEAMETSGSEENDSD